MAVPIPAYHPDAQAAYAGPSQNAAQSDHKTMAQLSEILNNHIYLLSAHQNLIHDLATYLNASSTPTPTAPALSPLSSPISSKNSQSHHSSSSHKNIGNADAQLLTTLYLRAQTAHTDALACQRLVQTRIQREKLERKAKDLRDKVGGGEVRGGVNGNVDGRRIKRRYSSTSVKMDVDMDEDVEQIMPNSHVHAIKRLRINHPPTARSYSPTANTSPVYNTTTTPTSAGPTTPPPPPPRPQPQQYQTATETRSAEPRHSSSIALHYDDLTPFVDARLARLEKLRLDPSVLNASGKKRAARFSGGGDCSNAEDAEMGSFMGGANVKRRKIGIAW